MRSSWCFGSPDHTRITIHFLNAVLKLPRPILSVEILNPIQGQDFSDDKLIVLDVLAMDLDGRRFNIEMQTTLPADLPKRLTYYNCVNYVQQLGSGDPYYVLRPAISICVLDGVLFPTAPEYHLSFRVRCDQRDLVLSDDLEFHLLELPKFQPPSDNVRALPRLEKWLYFLLRAKHMDAAELAAQLDEEQYREAVGVLEMIARTPEERRLYDARMKYLHDEAGRLLAAREEGLAIGLAKGREEGGRRGFLAGKIQILQELLGDEVSSFDELLLSTPESLTGLLSILQDRLRSRGA